MASAGRALPRCGAGLGQPRAHADCHHLRSARRGAPYPLSRVRRITRQANRLNPDLAVLLGDYSAAHSWTWGQTGKHDIIGALKAFKGTHGTFAVLGNHDWWQDWEAAKEHRPCEAQLALTEHGIPLLDNDAARLSHTGGDVWVVGLADQRPFDEGPDGAGFDDIEAAMAKVTDEAPVILLAHEPDLFPHVPAQCAVTLSGPYAWRTNPDRGAVARHHGRRTGNLFLRGAMTPRGRVMILSGGIGCSELPVRFNMPPELTVVTLCAPD